MVEQGYVFWSDVCLVVFSVAIFLAIGVRCLRARCPECHSHSTRRFDDTESWDSGGEIGYECLECGYTWGV